MPNDSAPTSFGLNASGSMLTVDSTAKLPTQPAACSSVKPLFTKNLKTLSPLVEPSNDPGGTTLDPFLVPSSGPAVTYAGSCGTPAED